MADSAFKDRIKGLSYLGAKALFWPVLKAYMTVKVRGGGRVPRRGGFLLAANHFSFVDPLLLGSFLRRRLWFIMAEDQFEKPVVKTFSRLMDVIPVKAGAAFRLAPIKRSLTLLKRGRAVAIFPEGRRSHTGKLLPAQPGLGVIASRAGVPIVPVAIVGTRECYPIGRTVPKPGSVTLYVGDPLTPNEGETPEDVGRRVMMSLAALLRDNGHEDYVDEAALFPAAGA